MDNNKQDTDKKKPWYEKFNLWLGIVVGIFALLNVKLFDEKTLIDFFKNRKATDIVQQTNTNLPTTTPLSEEKSEKGKDGSIVHTHKKFEIKKENIIKSKCNKKGHYDSVTYCQCGQEIKRKTITTKALRHKYKSGICIRCKHKDPNYVKVYNGKEIMKVLSKSIVSDCSSYEEYFDSDSISVFAKKRHNCFSINTAVSYNLWGGNVQTIKFNITDLNKFNKLNLKIGGETKSNGSMTSEFFVDRSFDKKANKIHDFDASSPPQKLSLNIKNATSLGIRVTNNSNNINNIVFFGFSVS